MNRKFYKGLQHIELYASGKRNGNQRKLGIKTAKSQRVFLRDKSQRDFVRSKTVHRTPPTFPW